MPEPCQSALFLTPTWSLAVRIHTDRQGNPASASWSHIITASTHCCSMYTPAHAKMSPARHNSTQYLT